MYQALYRKYRPKSFSDVYGQDHVVSTLRNEIKENRISHAYLFTGSRGTGKTTCAKILAKAVNCESLNDGDPCNRCEVCRGLDNGTIYDVVEIDAASNNGVDNIRDLREEANYTPSRGRYRVYIIDEVHMLSSGAFNALLKTLEEPPAHVIFILATTEVHKLPATILSRCQRFDFKRIQPETMALRLKEVAALENLELDDNAAMLIARIADGALRDGLSILDQCAGRNERITEKLVSETAGIAGREMLHSLCGFIADKSSSKAMELLSRIYSNSYDMERLCTDMIGQFRNLLMVKSVRNGRELVICTDDEFNQLKQEAEAFTTESIIYCLDLFQEALARIKSGVNSRIEMEMAFVKLCEPKLEKTAASLLERISRLEKLVQRGGISESPLPQASGEENPEPLPAEKSEPPEAVGDTNPVENDSAQADEAEEMQESAKLRAQIRTADNGENDPVQTASPPVTKDFVEWSEFMDIIHKTDIALFGVLSGASGSIVGEHFVIDSPNPTIKEFIAIPTHSKAIRQAVFEITGRNLRLAVAKKSTAQANKRDLLEDLINKAKNNVDIKFE